MDTRIKLPNRMTFFPQASIPGMRAVSIELEYDGDTKERVIRDTNKVLKVIGQTAGSAGELEGLPKTPKKKGQREKNKGSKATTLIRIA